MHIKIDIVDLKIFLFYVNVGLLERLLIFFPNKSLLYKIYIFNLKS